MSIYRIKSSEKYRSYIKLLEINKNCTNLVVLLKVVCVKLNDVKKPKPTTESSVLLNHRHSRNISAFSVKNICDATRPLFSSCLKSCQFELIKAKNQTQRF